jgi:DNA-binding GntR family transcriptional regulator
MNDLRKIVQPPSFKEHAYHEIKNAIIRHVFADGMILSERNLSDKLGISRTPLREALLQLELEGWLAIIPRKGIKISRVAKRDIDEVMQIRKANELLSVELLLPVVSDEQVQDLYARFAPAQSLSRDELFEITVGDDIHVYIAELCGNRRLLQILTSLSEQMRWFGYWAMQVPGRMDEVLEEHKLILNAIENRNLSQACQRIIEHLARSREAIFAGLPIDDANRED